MNCPHCGKEIRYEPKLTDELKFRIAMLAQDLVNEHGTKQEITGKDLSTAVWNLANATRLQPYNFNSAKAWIKARALEHPLPIMEGRTVRYRWIVDWKKMREIADGKI
jgi:hypothetical protein